MTTLTQDGFWPLIAPTPKSTQTKTKKTLMSRMIEVQERRAKTQIADILGSYDTDHLRKLGLSDPEIRNLIGSRSIATR